MNDLIIYGLVGCSLITTATSSAGLVLLLKKPRTSLTGTSAYLATQEQPQPQHTLIAPIPEPRTLPTRTELQADLDAYWKENPPDKVAQQCTQPRQTVVSPKVPAPPLTRGEKIRAAMQKKADEQGISVPEMMRQRTAKKIPKSDTNKAAPAFRKWKEGDRATVKKEIASALFGEDECLRVGSTVQVHSITKLSASVFDPMNPLRGIADIDKGIGGWNISLRSLELIEE